MPTTRLLLAGGLALSVVTAPTSAAVATGSPTSPASPTSRTSPAGAAVAASRPVAGSGPVALSRAHVAGHARALGLARGSAVRTVSRTAVGRGADLVRFQQTVGGVPVVAGQLVTTVRGSRVVSVAGEASTFVRAASFRRTASSAARTARAATAAAYDLPVRTLRAARPGRWLYDASLLQPGGRPGARAVWRVEVASRTRPDVRDLVLVDAATGAVALRVGQVTTLDRVVCDSAQVPSSEYVCKAGRYDRVEGQPATGVPDVDQAFDHTGATAAWFATRLGVDLTALIGFDRGDGRKLRSTTRYCPPAGCPYDNAAWTGDQMVYGPGFAAADDVVAHELAHGVTQHTAGLMYWYQSGAINESMSDVIGELVDLSDGLGTDTPETRWQLGEDLPARAGGITRDMSDPTLYGQPDHTASDLFEMATDYSDNGGVHTNSGVPNKTAYLVVDGTVAEPGGAFNGQAFAGIGLDKAAVLYWTALQTLTPGSDFSDLAGALTSSCDTLAATAAWGFTATDCVSVRAAVAATGLTRWAGPTVPRRVSMSGGIRTIRLSWERPSSPGSSPITSYGVYVSPAVHGQDFAPVEPTARRVDLRGFSPGRAYTVGLVAVTADGTSPPVVRSFAGSTLQPRWPGALRDGRPLRVPGRLLRHDGAALAGRTVALLHRRDGRWETLDRAQTGSAGRFVLRAPAGLGAGTASVGRYVLEFDGGRTVLGVRTPVQRLRSR